MAWRGSLPGRAKTASHESAILRTAYGNMRRSGLSGAHSIPIRRAGLRTMKRGQDWQDFADASTSGFRKHSGASLTLFSQPTLPDDMLSPTAQMKNHLPVYIHLKRALSMVTFNEQSFRWEIGHKGNTTVVLRFPEAYWRHTKTKTRLPNHQLPTSMANAALSLALLRYSYALYLVDLQLKV